MMQRAQGTLNAAARALALWRGSQQQALPALQQLQHIVHPQLHGQPWQQPHRQQHMQSFTSTSAAAASGISMPSPSRLDQLMKLSSLLEQSPEEIQNIWLQYHAEEAPGSTGRIASVQTAQEYATFRTRAKASPIFVLPVKKDGDGYVTLVLQVGPLHSAAAPHLTLVHYAELEVAKGLVLVRGDIINDALISAPEARTLMELVRAFYTDSDAYKLVHTFNHDPAAFDFNELLRALDPKGSAGGQM